MPRKKLIIDTDPGIDDTMAILAAFSSPEVEVVGLTTVYGNVTTERATKNAFGILNLAWRQDVPVAEGSHVSFTGVRKEYIASFVHGDDGFGNTNQPEVEGVKHELGAAEFIARTVGAAPGEVAVLALGPLTNLALALVLDPSVATKWAELVILGGAFFCNGNVHPAAEANFFGDPEAADAVFARCRATRVVGLDVTLRCDLSAAQLSALRGRGRFGTFLQEITAFYLQYHRDAYGKELIYLHDPAAFLAVLRPELFSWRRGRVCVQADGIAKGQSILDLSLKNWNTPNAWDNRPLIEVAVGAQSEEIVREVVARMVGPQGDPAELGPAERALERRLSLDLAGVELAGVVPGKHQQDCRGSGGV